MGMAFMGGGKRGLFGAPMAQIGTPWNPDPRAAPGAGPVQQDATVPTYAKPSTAKMIIGTIGDTLSQWGGGQGTFLPGLQRQREYEQQNAQYQRQRADKFTDWKAQEDYERANPKPVNNDTVNDYNFITSTRGADAGNRYLDQVIQNGGAVAPQITNIPGVGMVSIPRGPTGGGGGSGVPDGAVSMLRQNPGMAAQFDAKYGAGASSRYLGGAAPQAPSPFPIR